MSERTLKKWRRVKERLHFAAPHIDGFKSWLRDTGYTANTIDETVRLLAGWTDWIKALAFVAAIRERKDGADRTKGWDESWCRLVG
jgi:hypothetical protein